MIIWTLLLGLGLAWGGEREALDRALQLLVQRAGGQVDESTLYRAAIGGMAASLDQRLGTHGSALLTSAEAAEMEAFQRGERVGVGLEYSILPGRGFVVTDVFEGGPAGRAGLRRGDLVVALDDRPLTGLAPADIHAAVGAATGERVVMDVIKEGNALRRMVVLKGPHRPPPLRIDAEAEPPLVRIPWFSAGVGEALRRSLAELDVSEGLVLDLRHNQGGLVEEVVAVASLLLPEGSVVYLRTGPDGQATPVRARGRRAEVGRVVVLVDRGTAGPAELLVAALQDHRAARIIGVRTAGQGWVPSWTDLGSNLVLQLPDTGYRSPLGRSWNQRGLEPDVLVEAIDTPMSNGPGRVPVDVQRDTAIQLIKSP